MRAAMRKREAIQPRKIDRAEADAVLNAAGSNAPSIARERAGSAGVKERGEHTKVDHAYLGDLTSSAGKKAVGSSDVL